MQRMVGWVVVLGFISFVLLSIKPFLQIFVVVSCWMFPVLITKETVYRWAREWFFFIRKSTFFMWVCLFTVIVHLFLIVSEVYEWMVFGVFVGIVCRYLIETKRRKKGAVLS